jgi:hypothetical protein
MKKNIIFLLIIILLLIAIISCDADLNFDSGDGGDSEYEPEPCEVYVDFAFSGTSDGTQSAPYSSIIEAITNSSSGDVICFGDGEHTIDSETDVVSLKDGLIMQGSYETTNWTRDIGEYDTIITDNRTTDTSNTDPLRAVYADNSITSSTVLNGFVINGGGGNYSSAMFIDGGSPSISQTAFEGGNGLEMSVGIYIVNSASPIIYSNTVEGGESQTLSRGIYNKGSTPEIMYNLIDGGVQSLETQAVYNENCTIYFEISTNTIQGGSGYNKSRGIYSESSSDFLIYDNIIYGGSAFDSYGIFNTSGSSPDIDSNSVDGGEGSSSYGIYLNSNSLSSVTDNTITAIVGLHENDNTSDPAILKNNTFSDNDVVYHDADGNGDLSTQSEVNDASLTNQGNPDTVSGNIVE